MTNETVPYSIYESWNDVYLNNNVWNLPWVSKKIHPQLKKVIDSLPIKSGNALDVGCGLGQVSRYLAKIGFDVTAIDISDSAIQWCKKLNDTTKEIHYKVANSIIFRPNEQFNLIVDFLHIHDIERNVIKNYLINLEQLLTLDGYLIIATFSQNDPSNTNSNCRKSHFVNAFIHYYSFEEILKQMICQYGIVSTSKFIAGKDDEKYIADIYCIIKRNNNGRKV